MNYHAYVLLSIVHECECVNYPELIPSPWKIRVDPEFSDALDFLIDNDYLQVCWPEHSSFCDSKPEFDTGWFGQGNESLTITPVGIKVLEEEKRSLQNTSKTLQVP